MTPQKVCDTIGVIASVLDVPANTLSLESSMQTVAQWDSLAHLSICLAFQERFAISMDMQTIARATSVSALAALVSQD